MGWKSLNGPTLQVAPVRCHDCPMPRSRMMILNPPKATPPIISSALGSGVCSPTAHTDGSQYSTRRLNGNADAVIARIFSDYDGPLRTENASDAAVKVVPYPHSSNAACPRADGSFDVLRRDTDWTSRTDHLFLFAPPGGARLTAEKWGEGHDRLGNIVVPYVK